MIEIRALAIWDGGRFGYYCNMLFEICTQPNSDVECSSVGLWIVMELWGDDLD
jgi:hypothetical protein